MDMQPWGCKHQQRRASNEIDVLRQWFVVWKISPCWESCCFYPFKQLSDKTKKSGFWIPRCLVITHMRHDQDGWLRTRRKLTRKIDGIMGSPPHYYINYHKPGGMEVSYFVPPQITNFRLGFSIINRSLSGVPVQWARSRRWAEMAWDGQKWHSAQFRFQWYPGIADSWINLGWMVFPGIFTWDLCSSTLTELLLGL